MSTNNVPVLYIDKSMRLPDTDRHQFRFEVESGSTDNVWLISQNKKGGWWECDCPGWKRHRHCRHLRELGIPDYPKPYEPKIIER